MTPAYAYLIKDLPDVYYRFFISLDQPGYSISEIESSGRGFDADAKVERNGMRSGEQNRCLRFRGA